MEKKDITSIYYDKCIYRLRDTRLDGHFIKWSVLIDKTNNYLTIEALEDDLTVSFSTNTIQYSIDYCETWNELPADTTTPAINTGDMISFKATGLVPSEIMGIGTFTVNKNFNLKGNVMSMLFGDEGKNSYDLTGYDFAFIGLFNKCTTLQSVSKDFLPATTLAEWCYTNMFQYCTSLVTVPELPAAILAFCCYSSMFYGTNVLPDCTNIDFTNEYILRSGGLSGLFAGTKVTDEDLYNILPINPSTGKYWLPATTLNNSCYNSMFSGCTSLVTAPELPATKLNIGCYSSMFSGCTSLVTAPELPATVMDYSCYGNMFSDCTSLVTAPELPATTLADYCYQNMFSNCTSLVNAPELPATKLIEGCYSNMFAYCTSLVTAPELPATKLAQNCYNGMFNGCASLVNAPELPATTLAKNCYSFMFYGCTSLVNAPELPATTLAEYCYNVMFNNCTSLATAPELPATTLVKSCYNGMFSNCTKLNYIKALFTTEPGSNYTNNWVYKVSSTGTFVKSKNATWNVTGINGIPSGWTVQTV